ncbi:DUF1932 domain-containing protein [Albimonas pacifica]|uniref:3-hydroxyisobutyrate dehydrogenase n=1 Tax=Albimonas pacifica TaxID=1114924 RepID=A0A1I3FT01_9RHOB|nr:NAD(P)-dependent oxidoreductase [Albimonas pacifica]SFI14350.1 3-hydroxyisobutyrate dehydrogenase [Albimonas pacifica]
MSDASDNKPAVAFVGFGEAALAFLSGWAEDRPAHVAAYDVKTEDPAAAAAMRARYAEAGATGADTPAQALAGAQAAFCVVTADRALEAAQAAAAAGIPPGLLWFDCNSCAPDTKRAAAEVVEAAGGRYVDVAVMAPVHPKRHRVPLLVSGPHAAEAVAVLEALGMNPAIAGEGVGEASAIKMVRSVMIKGMEALTTECFLAARRAGVEERVIASLLASDPEVNWPKRGAYNLERMMVHGARRAAEMREVALTVQALGLPPRMAAATAEWQDDVARLGAEPGEEDLIARVDAVLARL